MVCAIVCLYYFSNGALMKQKVRGLLWIWQEQCLDSTLSGFYPPKQLLLLLTQHFCLGWESLVLRPLCYECSLIICSIGDVILFFFKNLCVLFINFPLDFRLKTNVRCVQELSIVQILIRRWTFLECSSTNLVLIVDYDTLCIYYMICAVQVTQADVKLFFESVCGEVCDDTYC